MPGQIHESTVVITGASSGIGRATALAFAQRGATVVLASRNEPALRELAATCEGLGGRALVVPTDVTDRDAIEALARSAIESFGRFDIWINNAAVALFARFDDGPPEAYRRVIETNLFGYIYGAWAALRHFRERGSGILINNASLLSRISQPYGSAYVVSKVGIRALSMCLRQELLLEGATQIHVCAVLPATIDTPFFHHAANYMGYAIRAVPPLYTAEQVADAMVRLAEQPQREVYVGGVGRLLSVPRTLLPGLTERVFAHYVSILQFNRRRPATSTPGNVFEPMAEPSGVSGGWQNPVLSVLRRAAPFALATLGIGLAARARSAVMHRALFGRHDSSRFQWLTKPIERAVGK